MNTHLWYLNGAKSANLVMPYINWKDFRFRLRTIDNLPIFVNFGDNNIQSVFGNGTEFIYSKASASNDEVIIYNANRLVRIDLTQSNPIYNVSWNFGLSNFRVCSQLLGFIINSGNISGDAGNLSPFLQTFQMSAPAFGAVTNLSPLPSTLVSFNQTSANANFNFEGTEIKDQMPLLEQFFLEGVSKVEMSLADLPSNLIILQISNTNPFTAINRRHRITYDPFVICAGDFGFMIRFVIDCENGFGFNQVELDAILIYLDSLPWNPPLQKIIRLSLGHGNRSQFSDDAVNNLSALPNMSITLNPKIII